MRPGRRINHVVSSYRPQKQQPNFGACLHGVQLLPLSSCCRCANQHRSAVWFHIHLFSRGACKRFCCSSVATHLTCAPLISPVPFFFYLLLPSSHQRSVHLARLPVASTIAGVSPSSAKSALAHLSNTATFQIVCLDSTPTLNTLYNVASRIPR